MPKWSWVIFASQVMRVPGSVTLEACPLTGEVELPKDIEVVMTSAAWFSRGVLGLIGEVADEQLSMN